MDINQIFSKNLIDLRKSAKMTQAELGEKLNYTDKAVSKWERGEAIPDVSVLKTLAELFSVSVDYLINEHDESTRGREPILMQERIYRKNRILITLISSGAVWTIAVLCFVMFRLLAPQVESAWLCYIYPIPVTAVVVLVLNCLWGRKPISFICVSIICWGTLLSLYLSIPKVTWMIFMIGIPAQVIIVLCFGLVSAKKVFPQKKEVRPKSATTDTPPNDHNA